MSPARRRAAKLSAAALFLFGASVRAVAGGAAGEDAHTRVALVAPEAFSPGARFPIEVRFEMEPGWHVYGKDPGEAGLPPKVVWRLPQGVTIGDFLWPAAKRITGPPVTTYGYKGSASLKAEAAVGDAFAADELVVEARVEWLACSDDACVPGRAELRTVLKTKPNKKENQP